MFSLGDISYLIGRAHGIIGNVLTKSQLSLLLASSNLKELRAAFTQTMYDEVIKDLNLETQMPEVDRRFKKTFSDLIMLFYRQTSLSAKKKIGIFFERYNAENLRYILHGKFMGMSYKEIISRIIPVAEYSLDYYEKLLPLTIGEIIDEQNETNLKNLLKDGYKEYESTGRFTPIESAIDQYIYDTLTNLSKSYSTYVNLKNILALSRCIALGIPAYRYILPNKFIAKALSCNTISEVLEKYNYGIYKTIFSPYIGRDNVPLHDLEFTVERYQLKKWKKIFRYGITLKIDVVIAFFELKLAETMDVIRIIVGINAGFSEKEIRESLLFYSLQM